MNFGPFGTVALVLLAYSCPCSASCLQWAKERPLAVISNLSKVPLRYEFDGLVEKLGFSIQFSDMIFNTVGPSLAATKNKDKPGVLANKFSINDFLAQLKVYKSDLTPERLQERRDFCDSLSPNKAAARPKNDYVLELIENNKYIKGYRHDSHEDEERKPQEFAFYKNLNDYCRLVFGRFLAILRDEFRVDDDELDKKFNQLTNEIAHFSWIKLGKYPAESLGVHPDPLPLLHADFTKTKQPEQVAEIKALCAELISRVSFIAELEFGGKKAPPVRYSIAYRYCKNQPWN